jgi:hypothetical protein
MAIIMFVVSTGILYLGHKKGTPNTFLWALFVSTRGLHWLVEGISDYYEEILDIEMLLFSQLELITAFVSSFILLAACIEYNGMIRRHLGKVITLLSSILPIYFILSINEDTLEEIEDIYILKGDIVSTELPRFLYGFILPLLSILALIIIYLYYYYHTKKGTIYNNPKVLKITIILGILIFIFSIFEGFDYYEDQELELVFVSLRAISLIFIIIIPLIIVFTFNLGLQKFLIIKHSGLLLYAYNFDTKRVISDDDESFLTSGFLTALLGFSKELSKKDDRFLAIQSHYLYYVITKTESKIYALQSISKNKNLEQKFFQAVKELDESISNMDEPSQLNTAQLKDVIDNNFSAFY